MIQIIIKYINDIIRQNWYEEYKVKKWGTCRRLKILVKYTEHKMVLNKLINIRR